MISRAQALVALERHDNEIRERLEASRRAVEEAKALVEVAKQEQRGVIEEAIAEGWSMNRIADLFGLSKQRIAQIRKEGD